MRIASRTDNYQTGDCFEFKERIRDFGVVFLKENMYEDETQLNFFPIKLDTSKVGIDRFKYGKVYLSSFMDLTKPSGKTEGFNVYFFLNQNDFKLINDFFSYVGSISIQDKYKNHTGGTSASNYDEFRFQLDRWDEMFGQEGQLVPTTEIIK